jgi:molecular chaperone DnaK (HSP70)
MKWFSRLLGSQQSEPKSDADGGGEGPVSPPVAASPRPPAGGPDAAISEPVVSEQEPTADDRTAETLRLGLDFGTSTTLVAVRVGNRPPRLLELEPGRAELPSYVALGDGQMLFGQRAVNAGVSVHSLKLALRKNEPIAELDGMLPDRAAFLLISHVVERALEQLRREGRLPPSVQRLEVATNVGCTPAFSLEERVRLRDICNAAGLTVSMINLVEEPVAAAFEVARTGLAKDGRTMVVDIGGGTIDVSVLAVKAGGTDFTIYASGGIPLAGDKFTDIIAHRLINENAVRTGVLPEDLSLSAVQRTAIWNRAEAAKISLSTNETVRM